jgi:hypothetical protein
MRTITTIGLDIAKSVFQVHGVRANGDVVVRRQLKRPSAPIFVQFLTSLSAVLDKAAAHAEAKKIDPAVLLNTRLYPDMLPSGFAGHLACAAHATI